jgi:hypothetical protein
MTEQYDQPNTPTPNSSKGLLIIAWLIVGLPALWGVSQTVQTSMKLFNPPASTQHAAPATAPVIPPATSPS